MLLGRRCHPRVPYLAEHPVGGVGLAPCWSLPSTKTAAAAALFAVPVLALSACSPNEPVATSPGTTPSIWTGSASPSQGQGGPGTGPAATGEKLTPPLKLADRTTAAPPHVQLAGVF